MKDTPNARENNIPRDEFTITLTDVGGDARPVAIRLRQLLKLSLRGFKLRCTEAHGIALQEVQP